MKKIRKITDIVPGDIAIIISGSSRGMYSIIIDVCSPIEPSDEQKKDIIGNNENMNENVWLSIENQKSYWKSRYNVDIGKPTYILKVIHITCEKIFYYPDTVVDVIKNEVIRAHYKKMEEERRSQSKKDIKLLKKESRIYDCPVCARKIHDWQKIVYIHEYPYTLTAYHKKCYV